MAICFSQKPEQKVMPIHVPEPQTFFLSDVNGRKKILQPLYLYTLIEYLELLEQYRQKNRDLIERHERILATGDQHRGSLRSRSKYDGSKQQSTSNSTGDDVESLEQKLERIFSVKKNIPNNKGQWEKGSASSGNHHGYKNQLTEDIQLNGEEIDQLIGMIEERLEQIQVRRMMNEGSFFQDGYQGPLAPPQQQLLSSQPPEQPQKPQQQQQQQQKPGPSPSFTIQQQKPFKRSIFDDLLLPKVETEVIDLTVRRPSEASKAEESELSRIRSIEEREFRTESLSPTSSIIQPRRLPTPMPPIVAGKPRFKTSDQSSTEDFMKLGGHILPLPEDFNQLDQTKQNEILAKLSPEIRRKYLNMCWTIQEQQNCLNVDACF